MPLLLFSQCQTTDENARHNSSHWCDLFLLYHLTLNWGKRLLVDISWDFFGAMEWFLSDTVPNTLSDTRSSQQGSKLGHSDISTCSHWAAKLNISNVEWWVLNYDKTRMWANAQRDGRPAEYRWRPLFNAAKFGWRPLLECCAVTLLRRETCWNLPGVPKTPKPISAASGPKFTILWGHVGEILLFDRFFRLLILPLVIEVVRWCPGGDFFCVIFVSCIFSKPCAAHFRHAF